MNTVSQLLCTFLNRRDITSTLEDIKKTYTLFNKKIYVFNDKLNKDNYFFIYNIFKSKNINKIKNTILVHRKHQTNTIYTLNALNKLIMDDNNGVLDKQKVLEWELYKDCIILSSDPYVRIINVEFDSLIKI